MFKINLQPLYKVGHIFSETVTVRKSKDYMENSHDDCLNVQKQSKKASTLD